MTRTDALDYGLHWDEGDKPFYEVYYLKWNDPVSETAGWLRYTLHIPLEDRPRASLWGLFFDAKNPEKQIAIKQDFPLDDVAYNQHDFTLAIGPAMLTRDHCVGVMTSKKDKFEWDFKIIPQHRLSVYPQWMYGVPWPKTKFVCPHVSALFNGWIQINDRRIPLQQVPGHEGHLWGTSMAERWFWGNCIGRSVKNEEFIVEALSAQVRMGPILTPPLTTLHFYWRDQWYSFHQPMDWFRNKTDGDNLMWNFSAENKSIRFSGTLTAHPQHTLCVKYLDPSGGKRFCHNTKLADMKVRVEMKKEGKWLLEESFSFQKQGAFEIVQPELLSGFQSLIG